MAKHVDRRAWTRPGSPLLMAAALGLLLAPGIARAQQIGIGGTVSDSSGAALPGVIVEVSSPALIEKARTTVSNSEGQYLIVGLVPGTYSVKFSLTGFSNVVREGVQLTTGFTASINAELAVGGIAETVTVSGDSPLVDVQNISQQQVMSREVMDTIPTGKSINSYGLLIPGMNSSEHRGSTLSQDAGGQSVQNRQRLSIHGSLIGDQQMEVNGLDVGDSNSSGLNLAYFPDTNMQEIAFQYSGSSAESETGGVRINMIPKEGANRFAASLFTTFSFPELQANNVDEELISKGILDPNTIDQVWSFSPNIGGPIVRDRVWFFLAHASQRAFFYPSGVYWGTNPAALTFTPNPADRMLETSTAREQSLNLTLQGTSKDKFKLYWTNSSTRQDNTLAGRGLGGSTFVAPEAAIAYLVGANVYQLNWIRPQTNRLLFQAGASHQPLKVSFRPADRARVDLPGVMEVSPNIINSRNASYNGPGAPFRDGPKSVQSVNAAASYVTGSHNLKVGMTGLKQWSGTYDSSDLWQTITVSNGAPISTAFYASNNNVAEAWTWGVFAQDQWRVRRLTVNAGLRYDHVIASYPDQGRPVNKWVTQPFPIEGREVTNWKDLQPRLGGAYDLFGTGKTALKASVNRSGRREAVTRAQALNPSAANRTMTRVWNDSTCVSGVCIPGDGIPQGDPLNPQPNGELLNPNTNLNFGRPAITAFYDPEWAFGWATARHSGREARVSSTS